jgi:Zn-dependent peptidase ImmA (M78 family)/transcriptional regulator with XRE-family HTH domain
MTTRGEAIHNARLSTGMSQADLASRAGLTQATLSRYETGSRDPDTATLKAVATELGVGASLLESLPVFHRAVALPEHMRRRGTAKATQWRMLEARLNMLRIHVRRLADVADLKFKFVVPRFDPSAFSAAEAARRVRSRWGMPPGPVESMLVSMEDAGCFVAPRDLESPRIPALSQWIDTYPVVMANSRAHVDEMRLTIAHELGHLVLHSEPGSEPVGAEREAAEFATAFLLPEHDAYQDLADMSLRALRELKVKWRVPMRTLMERAHRLGAIDERRRNSIYKMLSKRGWLAAEPLSDVLPPEEPRLFDRMAAALNARGYSDYAVAAIGGFSDIASARRLLLLTQP